MRKRGVDADDGDEDDSLVMEVASLVEFGVFKNIVDFFCDIWVHEVHLGPSPTLAMFMTTDKTFPRSVSNF